MFKIFAAAYYFMKKTIIAPLGGELDALFVGIHEFPTEKVILIPAAGSAKQAQNAREELAKFRIPVESEELEEHTLEAMFEAIRHIKNKENSEIAINLGCASKPMGLAATAAAFVNGIGAFDVVDDRVITLPVLKFSYYDVLSDKKMKMLKTLYSEGSFDSLENLSKKISIGPSLINYHIYGNNKNPGLKELGLVEISRGDGKVKIALSTMGKLLLKEKKKK
ncbi:MAG: DUF6293 family protein [archaeon]|nr:DUF6293 family protein [archaeon]